MPVDEVAGGIPLDATAASRSEISDALNEATRNLLFAGYGTVNGSVGPQGDFEIIERSDSFEIRPRDPEYRDDAGFTLSKAGGVGPSVLDSEQPDAADLDPYQIDSPELARTVLNETEVRVTGGDLATLEAAIESDNPDRTFTSAGGGTTHISAYESGARENLQAGVEFDTSDGDGVVERFVKALRVADVSEGGVDPETDTGLVEAAEDRDTRRALRERLDSALEAEGYDPGEWNTDARADGTLILQDPETNRTRTIGAGDDLDSTVDSFGGDSDVQPESDGGSGEQGGDGLDRRAIGAGLIVAAAAAYGVTQL